MWGTILSLFTANWKDIGKFVGLVGIALIVCFFVYSWNQATAQMEQAKADAQTWKSNYGTVVNSLDKVNRQLNDQIKETHRLENILLDRESRIQELQTRVDVQIESINNLERDNEEVRRSLGTVIPNELWWQIFPTAPGSNSGNENSQNPSSPQSTPAIPAPTGAKK